MKQVLSFLFVLLLVSAKSQKYDKIDSLREGLRKVTKSGKTGFINTQGEVVIELVYEAANGFYEGVSAVKKNGKVGYIDKNNRIVVPFEYDGGNNFNKGYAVVSGNKKNWLIDKKGRQVTLRKYDLLRYNKGLGMMVLDKKWGYLNEAGQEIIPPEYDMIHNYGEGFIGAKKGGKWGYIDTLDQVQLPFEFESVSVFENGRAVVERNGKTGVIDKSGKTLISFNYQSLYLDDATGWYIAEKKDKTGMIDQRGRETIPFEFDDIDNFSEVNEGYALVIYKDKTGMIDVKGNIIIQARYDKIFECKNGYCGVELNKKYGMVALQNGKEILEPKYDGLGNFSEDGIAIYKKNIPGVYYTNAKFGFVNTSGKEITAAKYEKVEDFSNRMAAVQVNNKWGYINTEGNEAIFPRYESAEDFKNEKAIVKEDGKYLYIDKKGRLSEIPESEKPKSEFNLSDEDLESMMKIFAEVLEQKDGKHFVLSTNKAPQSEQVVVSSKTFPEAAIKKYWDQNYYIIDLTVSADTSDVEYTLVMGKARYTDQSWAKRNTDITMIESVREKYKASNKNLITYLNFINNEWVAVYSQNTPFTSQIVSAAGTTVYPEAWVNEKWQQGYVITNMACGKGKWLVVMTKGADYAQQKLSISDKVEASMLEERKAEGYILTDLVKNGSKYYSVFSKVANIQGYRQDKVVVMEAGELKKVTQVGNTIIRSILVPGN